VNTEETAGGAENLGANDNQSGSKELPTGSELPASLTCDEDDPFMLNVSGLRFVGMVVETLTSGFMAEFINSLMSTEITE
jgi:hypothetical protein